MGLENITYLMGLLDSLDRHFIHLSGLPSIHPFLCLIIIPQKHLEWCSLNVNVVGTHCYFLFCMYCWNLRGKHLLFLFKK